MTSHSDKKRILFIGAHTDDIELACGGTIAKYIALGHDVRCYTFSYCDNMQLLLEFQRSMDVLGVKNYVLNTYNNRIMDLFRQKILDDLLDYKISFTPDIVFTHDPADIHQDHATVGTESIRAFKNHNVITYLHPWNANNHKANMFVSFGRAELDKKIEACKEYESQNHRNYMQETMIESNASYWTNRSPYDNYCEAFNIYSLYD